MGDLPVETLFPQGRKCFEWGASGWSWVLGIDSVGGPPHCDFADEGGARVASGWCPDWFGVAVAGVVMDLIGEVSDDLGSPRQVSPPDGMGMERWWNAWEPGQRTGLVGVSSGRRQSRTAAMSPAVLRSRPKAAVSMWRSGCSPVSAANASRWARRVGQAGSVVSPGRYWSTWSSSATVWGPTSCSAATWRPSV